MSTLSYCFNPYQHIAETSPGFTVTTTDIQACNYIVISRNHYNEINNKRDDLQKENKRLKTIIKRMQNDFKHIELNVMLLRRRHDNTII